MEHPQTPRGADYGSSARRYAGTMLLLAIANSLIACGRVETTASNSPTGSTTLGGLTLTWDAVADPNLAGYRVYYGTQARTYLQLPGYGQPVATGTTTYQLTDLSPNTYYFAVTAYDSLGNESSYSNEVSRTIP
jgi:hypothetical protein